MALLIIISEPKINDINSVPSLCEITCHGDLLIHAYPVSYLLLLVNTKFL